MGVENGEERWVSEEAAGLKMRDWRAARQDCEQPWWRRCWRDVLQGAIANYACNENIRKPRKHQQRRIKLQLTYIYISTIPQLEPKV